MKVKRRAGAAGVSALLSSGVRLKKVIRRRRTYEYRASE